MIILGFHESPTDWPQYWSSAYVAAFTNVFHDYFIDLLTLGGGENAKSLMRQIGQITDESEITTKDLFYIDRGDWPISWFRDDTDAHPNNEYGAKVQAILLKNRLIELGMI